MRWLAIDSVEGVSGGSTPIGSGEGVLDSGGSISSGSGGLICGLIYGGFIRGGDVLSGGVSIVWGSICGGSICGGSTCGDWIGSVKGDSNSGPNRGVRLSNDCGAQHRLEICHLDLRRLDQPRRGCPKRRQATRTAASLKRLRQRTSSRSAAALGDKV